MTGKAAGGAGSRASSSLATYATARVAASSSTPQPCCRRPPYTVREGDFGLGVTTLLQAGAARGGIPRCARANTTTYAMTPRLIGQNWWSVQREPAGFFAPLRNPPRGSAAPLLSLFGLIAVDLKVCRGPAGG